MFIIGDGHEGIDTRSASSAEGPTESIDLPNAPLCTKSGEKPLSYFPFPVR